jgi:hypothetical protein
MRFFFKCLRVPAEEWGDLRWYKIIFILAIIRCEIHQTFQEILCLNKNPSKINQIFLHTLKIPSPPASIKKIETWKFNFFATQQKNSLTCSISKVLFPVFNLKFFNEENLFHQRVRSLSFHNEKLSFNFHDEFF